MDTIKFDNKPLTDELISKVKNYFKTGDMGGLTESRIRLTYGRMRYHGIKIDKAEEYLEKARKEKGYSNV